jgi:hypothetical protein
MRNHYGKLLLAGCVSLLGLALPLQAASLSTLAFRNPPNVNRGAMTDVDIYFDWSVSGVAPYSYQFDVAYDPAHLQLLGIEEGPLLGSAGAATFFIPGEIDNQAGRATMTAGTMVGPPVGPFWYGVLVVMHFRAVELGQSPLVFSNVVFLNDDQAQFPVEARSGTLNVTLPEPESLAITAMALMLLFVRSRHRTRVIR